MEKLNRKAKAPVIILSVLVVIAIGGLTYGFTNDSDKTAESISGSGIIEGSPVIIRTKVVGEILELKVSEGDRVIKGQVLGKLDAELLKYKVRQAEARLKMAKSQVVSAQAVLDLTEKEITGKIKQAKAGVGIAEALLIQAQAGYDQAKHDYEIAEKMYADGIIPENDLMIATSAMEAAKGKLAEARGGVNSAVAVLEQVKAGETNTKSSKESGTLNKQVEHARAGLDAALAQQQLAQAVLEEARDVQADIDIISPIDGTITLKVANNGELLTQGMPLVEITDLSDLHIKIYVSETEIGRVKLGQLAQIRVDSAPGRSYSGKVNYISNQAEFTPNNVHMKEDRVKLVYAVKIAIDNAKEIMKPGMPADVVLQ